MAQHKSESADKPDDQTVPRPSSASDSAHEEPDRPRWGSTNALENLANLLTLAVAVAAIGLSIWQGYQNRQFYRLSVLPQLQPIEATIVSTAELENEYFLLPGQADSLYAVGYSVENSGLGPAVLQNLLVYRGETKVFDAVQSGQTYFPTETKADLQALPFPISVLNYSYSAGALLEAGEVHHLVTAAIPFAAIDPDSIDPRTVVTEVLDQRSYVFCYCSVYGTDCGMTSLGADPPEENVCAL